MIFLTEGDSASASIVASRDPLVQAVFSLRGKPLNVFGMKLDQLYKNEEMFNLMNALNIEDDIAQLRYNKVILGYGCRCGWHAHSQLAHHLLFDLF